MAGLLAHGTAATEPSPFMPGQGKLPPHLAGREREPALIRRFLEVLARRGAPASDIAVYGPRGNGKTALLLWTRREAQALGIDVLRFSGAVVPTAQSLAGRTSAMPRWLRWLAGFSLPGMGNVTLKDTQRQVSAVLSRRGRKRPTLLAIDEAHRLGTEPGAVLLNEVQDLRGDELPVMLILAGTPDLPRHLRTMGASFWDRSLELPIGRLAPESAAEAVRVPLEEHGRSIEETALQQVVAESHGYPFFLQVWGDLLWEGCEDPSRPMSASDVSRVRPLVEQRRGLYYRHRYEELKKADLVDVARDVAAAFAGLERQVAAEVEAAITASLRKLGRISDRSAVTDACDRLLDLGFLWSVIDQNAIRYEPGIPSLMEFVSLNRSRK